MGALFFSQLQTFSERVFEVMGLKATETPWTYGPFVTEVPVGAVLHFTAGNIPEKAIRWFMVQKYDARASANAIVLDAWQGEWMRKLAKDLPLIQALPAPIVQCMPPTKTTWHATWKNRTHYGIEMVNAGEVRPAGEVRKDAWGNIIGGAEAWTYSANDWKTIWESSKTPVLMNGRYWEPYSPEQVHAVAILLRRLRTFCGDVPDFEIVGHENVSRKKFDPGPLFPIHAVRWTSSFEVQSLVSYPWFTHFCADEKYMLFYRDGIALDWAGSPTRSLESVRSAEARVAYQKLIEAIRGELQAPENGFGATGKAGLSLLGYEVSNVVSPDLYREDVESIGTFQKMMGLLVDGIPGKKTREALWTRLKERGFDAAWV